MGEQEPEAEHWLGKNIKDGVGNDFCINIDNVSTFRKTPDAVSTWLA